MHRILYLKFAMWLNPRFEYFIIRFASDNLIEFRHDAGDLYRVLGRAIGKFEDMGWVNYTRMAKGLNHLVFGCHAAELLQHATPGQLSELADVQRQLAFAIDMGFIKTFDDLMSVMRDMYKAKWLGRLTTGR